MVFHSCRLVFHGSRFIFMVFQVSRLVFHGFRWAVMIFHGSRLVFHGSRLVFHVFFMATGLVFMMPGEFVSSLMVPG